ncbi:MAG TPA: hypothetical protein VMD02_06570 [Candidatus Omnitrophota bacterium]|nr:hypothetical protein [Candidatus Omnitrophota bacterium]
MSSAARTGLILSLLILFGPSFAWAFTSETTSINPTFEARPANPLTIKGTRIFAFTSRSLEGTKEGYYPGAFRDESLRLTIAGSVNDTDINANFFETSTVGTTQTASTEQKISILLKRGANEAYFGDFTADLTDTEFARLDKVLSGIKLKSDLGKLKFEAIASTPQGESKEIKMYGNGSQGPYSLGYQTVVDSERVYLDGVSMKRGSDYEIDYNSGTVTFKNRTILKTELIDVFFDYRNTTYQHSTYALRTEAEVRPGLTLGFSAIDDSDSMAGAQDIFAVSSGEAPRSHYLLGADGRIDLGETLKGNGELAYSEINPDLLSANAPRVIGKAGKLDLTSNLGPLMLGTRYKRIGPAFETAATAQPQQDLLDQGLSLSFLPNDTFSASGNLSDSKYTQSGTRFSNGARNARIAVTPSRLPSLGYLFDEYEQSNDPVPPNSTVDRLVTKNYYSLDHSLGKLILSARTGQESWLDRYPSRESTVYHTTNFGLSTSGLENFASSVGVELKDSEFPGDQRSKTRSANLSVSATPSPQYSAFGSFDYSDDSRDGVTNVTDLSYKAAPSRLFNTDGKLTIQSLKESFGPTDEEVIKNSGSFKFEFRPHPALRARYYFKPNYTWLSRTQAITYNNETHQYDLSLSPASYLVLGASTIRNLTFAADKNDLPDYRRAGQSRDDITSTYTVKAAPFNFMSVELNQTFDDFHGSELVTSATPETYQGDNGLGREFNAALRTSLSERFAVDVTYSNKITRSGTTDSGNDQDSLQTVIGSLKGIFNPNDIWSFSLSYAFTRSFAFNCSPAQVTDSIAPGAGFVFRYYDRLRIEGDYTLSRSVSGAAAERSIISLRGKYDLSDFIHTSLRYDREVSSNPDYRTTDISGYIEINL